MIITDKSWRRGFKICISFNLGTGRSVKINTLFNFIKRAIGKKPRLIRKKLEKFDPKKSNSTLKKLNKFLKLKKNNFTKIEDGLLKTINYMKRTDKK